MFCNCLLVLLVSMKYERKRFALLIENSRSTSYEYRVSLVVMENEKNRQLVVKNNRIFVACFVKASPEIVFCKYEIMHT